MAFDTVAGDTMNATWSPSTNWTSVRGTLVNCITFESSLYPIDGDEITNLNSIANRPLILRPSAPDTGPCEITINFTQKHEVQQIYVRSTARVYEIYYELDLQSGKVYLCTVRCGIAARDEELLHATDITEAISANSKEPHENASEKKLRNDCNRTTSEDEWVEVKVPDASVLGKRDNSLPLSTQDYYEATAQISDAHPCRSITIRLLSIQSKDTVYVDEVYVFADPVHSTESENQAYKTENSIGNSLMAMLLPNLLQMSKTKGFSATREEDKHTSEASRTHNFQESASEATCSTKVVNKAQEEGSSSIVHHEKIELQDVNTTGVHAAKLLNLPQDPVGGSKTHGLPSNDRMERVLDQLVSRMGRIEDLFLRFEDHLLKPISSIEARLHRVEQQLEVLANKQKDSEPQLYTRFYAPNFSFMQSYSSSFYHGESDYPHHEEFGSNVKSKHFDVQTTQDDDVSDSVNATQLLPSPIVTAPEFSNRDDEEEIRESERSTESSADKPRKLLTVDDALASALAGLVSSIPIQLQNHIPSLSIRAPEFSNEEDTEVNRDASPRGQLETGTDGADDINRSLSNASSPSLDGEKNVERSLNDYQSEETAEEVGRQYLQYWGREEDEPSGRPMNNDDDKAGTQNFERAEGTECGEGSTEANSGLVHNETDATGSATTSADLYGVAENKKVGSGQNKDILHDVLEFSHAAASVVDFESPVLDVKFISQNSLDSNFTLEALLSDSPEPESKLEGATCVSETHDATASDGPCDLILLEDGEEPVGPVTNSPIFVDFDYCSLPQETLCSENETPMAPTSMSFCSHETFPASLL